MGDKKLERMVFCKDCAWWEPDRGGRCKLFSFGINCTTATTAEDFCSRGVRKAEEE